jgi:hypothetical protein
VRNRPASWSGFVAKCQRDGGTRVHARLRVEKIEVMWHVLLIFLNGFFAQKTMIFITADTLYYQLSYLTISMFLKVTYCRGF